MSVDSNQWKRTSLCRRVLDLEMTLFNGQAFLWRRVERNGSMEYYGFMDNILYGLRHGRSAVQPFDSDPVEFCVFGEDSQIRDHYDVLSEYFNLEVDLQSLRTTWCKADRKHLASICDKYEGIRVLTVDPLECLLSFISSSNNNIKRISQMMWNLCEHFPQNQVKASQVNLDFFRFPSLSQLSEITETTLRELGFGFRAPFIVRAIQQVIQNGGIDWLRGLGKLSRMQACVALQRIAGCGPKVANCFCMCSLRKFDSVPVDTHCLQLMRKHYVSSDSPLLRGSSLSARKHDMLGDILRSIFGKFVSWAFMLLFTAELADFRPRHQTRSRFFRSARSKAQRQIFQQPAALEGPTRRRGAASPPRERSSAQVREEEAEDSAGCDGP